MPSIKAPATVLVTGASGFIAAWVCKTFLDAGYTVCGTVRSPNKGEYLAGIFKEYEGRFQYTIIEDIVAPGAFDEAVKGVQAVVHTASPTTYEANDPQDLIQPAVRGTTNLLESIQKYAPEVQRVVVTSSGSTIVDPSKPVGTVFTEGDWNTWSVKQVEEKGKDAGKDMYRASKVLAEQAAWSEASKQTQWDLVTIHPLITLGPLLHPVSDVTSLNTSIAMLYNIISAKDEELSQEVLLAPNSNFGDVRDVALAHLRAMEIPDAGGERFIACNGAYTWQDALDVLPDSHPRGVKGAGKAVNHIVFDSSKAMRILGIDFRRFEDTVRDTAADLKRRGIRRSSLHSAYI